MMHAHRNPAPPPTAPVPESPQVPGFDEHDAGRGHRDNPNVEGGPARTDPSPVDTEGT
jgi:hypothetical protein